jgi:hypothetical protein
MCANPKPNSLPISHPPRRPGIQPCGRRRRIDLGIWHTSARAASRPLRVPRARAASSSARPSAPASSAPPSAPPQARRCKPALPQAPVRRLLTSKSTPAHLQAHRRKPTLPQSAAYFLPHPAAASFPTSLPLRRIAAAWHCSPALTKTAGELPPPLH